MTTDQRKMHLIGGSLQKQDWNMNLCLCQTSIPEYQARGSDNICQVYLMTITFLFTCTNGFHEFENLVHCIRKKIFRLYQIYSILWCIGVPWSLTIGLGDEGNPWVILSTQVCLRALAPETRNGKREPDLFIPGSAA